MSHQTLSRCLAAGLLLLGFFIATRCLSASPTGPGHQLELMGVVDARDAGYSLTESGVPVFFRAAVYDLIQGRIRYFEQPESGHWVRYTLAGRRSSTCIPRGLHDEHLHDLPWLADTCLSAHPVPAASSRYRMDVEPALYSTAPQGVSLRDLQTGEVLAQYEQSCRFPCWLRTLARRPQQQDTQAKTGLPLWMLGNYVFMDRWGRTLSLKDLNHMRAETADAGETADLLPPATWVRRHLAYDNQLDSDTCRLPGWSGPTEIHALELQQGPLEVDARLDPQNSKAGVVLLDVHAPDKAVILLLRAQNPTIWHIHESSRSVVVAVLVRGTQGQAVLGLTPFSRILMSTQAHNPFTNCSAQALEAIETQVTGHYGITKSHRPAARGEPPIVRYSIGDEMPESGQLFHHHHELADFEIAGDS